MKADLKTALSKLTTIDMSHGMTDNQEEVLETLDTLMSKNLIDDIIEGLPEEVDTVVDIIICGDDDHQPLERNQINEIVEVMGRWQ